jgi:hypothetical protein
LTDTIRLTDFIYKLPIKTLTEGIKLIEELIIPYKTLYEQINLTSSINKDIIKVILNQLNLNDIYRSPTLFPLYTEQLNLTDNIYKYLSRKIN